MNSTKQHAFPGYDEIAEQLQIAAKSRAMFSSLYCQSLLETVETYAQEAVVVPRMRMLLLEVVSLLETLPYSKNKVERDKRLDLIRRIRETLKYDQNDQGTVEPSESAG